MNLSYKFAAIITIISCFFNSHSAFARERICLDKDWTFAFGNASDPAMDFGCGTEYFNYLTKANSIHNEGPYSIDKFDANRWGKKWQSVDLPHDWVVDLPYSKDASHSHGYKQVGYKYPTTSIGWYRKFFTVDASVKGKHFQLQFDGIFRNSQVWVNGFYLGGERSGYAQQVYDISEYLNYGDKNLICVRADATLEEGWFYEGAGIYRHVWLNITSPVHVAPNGTFVHSTFADTNDFSTATVTIETTIDNKGNTPCEYSIRHNIIDPNGKEIDEIFYPCESILPKDSETTSTDITISNPHLWCIDTPALYTIVTEVFKGSEVIDTYTTKTGIRHIRFDHNNGFFLNGKPLKLKGFNMHQDHAGVGAAIPDALQVYRIKKLKELGCNAYRSSHNPMTPEMLNACDSLGMLVIEENRLTGINTEHTALLKKMITRDRNHPSIILWSVGNEEWGIEWKESGSLIAESMREYCHRFDPTRLKTVATSSGPTIVVPADVAGYNYILQNPVDQHRSDYPNRCAYGSEETSGCGTRGIYFNNHENGHMIAHNRCKNGPDSIYNCIERGWKFYAERPWLAGLFYWTGFDYRGEPNPMKFPATGSQFGVLDYCGFPKDEAHYLRSWWTTDTVLHILPHWNLNGHEGESVSIWAYSNCDEVALIVNGKNLGRKAMPRNGHLEWQAIYQPGSVKAIGYKNGKKIATQVIETTGKAVSLKVEKEFTQDNIAIYKVSAIDSKGRLVPDACINIKAAISGNAKILGVGNGDPAWQAQERPNADSPQCMNLSTFNGLAQIIIQGDVNAHLNVSIAQ